MVIFHPSSCDQAGFHSYALLSLSARTYTMADTEMAQHEVTNPTEEEGLVQVTSLLTLVRFAHSNATVS